MPPKRQAREPDRGLKFLEQKLSIYANGPAPERRNHALDLLTGRVPDERVPDTFGALALAPQEQEAPAPKRTPPTVVLPLPRVPVAPRPIGMPTDASASQRPPASVWVEPAPEAARPRLRLVSPPLTRRPWWIPSRSLVVMALVAAGLGVGAGAAYRTFFSVQEDPKLVAVEPEAVVEPTPAPEPSPIATVAPPPPPAVATTVTSAGPAPTDQFRIFLDEKFDTNARGWLDQPDGTAYWGVGGYFLEPRKPGQFVAVSVPGTENLQDVVLSGTFRKTKGPDGGGYGLIVRDQYAGTRDGQSQAGRFYVFEIGDRGELGVWLRDGDRWVDLLAWTASDVVRPGIDRNELTVSAIGDRLSFMVNGIPVASQRDAMLQRGSLGVFSGGDGNQVLLERLTVRVPR